MEGTLTSDFLRILALKLSTDETNKTAHKHPSSTPFSKYGMTRSKFSNFLYMWFKRWQRILIYLFYAVWKSARGHTIQPLTNIPCSIFTTKCKTKPTYGESVFSSIELFIFSLWKWIAACCNNIKFYTHV